MLLLLLLAGTGALTVTGTLLVDAVTPLTVTGTLLAVTGMFTGTDAAGAPVLLPSVFILFCVTIVPGLIFFLNFVLAFEDCWVSTPLIKVLTNCATIFSTV